MTAPCLTRGRSHRRTSKGWNGLRHLGWPHYWLLVSILAAGLASFVSILFLHLSGS